MSRCERDGNAAMAIPVFRETASGLVEHVLCFKCYYAIAKTRSASSHLTRGTSSGGVHTPAPRSQANKVPRSSPLSLFPVRS